MLVDTSIWVDHLRRGDPALTYLLRRAEVECHPFIIGELACGRLKRGAEILALLRKLPQAPLAGHEEVLAFIEARQLVGIGVGWIDVHLLSSAALLPTLLWTRDRRLGTVARRLGLYAEP